MQLSLLTPAVIRRLATAPPWVLNTYAMVTAFSTYFCMYAFRKPFAAGTFEGFLPFGSGVSVKTAFVISQIVGYALAKFLGARVLPELAAERRPQTILGLVAASWTALLAFALSDPWVQMFSLFLNGLCLGMIWGLVVGFLEGRRASELLLAGLSCSFIVASGAVKDVGRALMRNFAVSEEWMPFLTAAAFVPLLILSVWALAQIPPPTTADEKERRPRTRMLRTERRYFLRQFAAPLSLSLAVYFFLTAFRDYRDNYGVELFAELGYGAEPALFTATEVPVAIGVMGTLALLSLVRNNKTALGLMFAVMSLGLLLLSSATVLLRAEVISGATWMVLLGVGSYLTYVPFGSMLFERVVAHTRIAGTAIYGIYLADALGYTGSICVQLYADVFARDASRLNFFIGLTHAMSLGGALLLAAAGWLWMRPPPKRRKL